MSTGEVVGGIFLSRNQLLWMKQLTVYSRAHFVDDSGLQIKEDCPRDMLSSPGLAEESVKGVVPESDSLVSWHLAIRLNAVLQAVKFPAGITDLDTSLSNVNGNALSHDDKSQTYGVNRVEMGGLVSERAKKRARRGRSVKAGSWRR